MDRIILNGTAARGRFGTSLANLGDINKDGYEGTMTFHFFFFFLLESYYSHNNMIYSLDTVMFVLVVV